MYVQHVWPGIMDDDGVEHVEVQFRLTKSEADALVASFDPGSAVLPPEAECRAIARPVAEAIAALPDGGAP